MNVEPTSEANVLRQIAKEFRFDGQLENIQIGAVAEHLRAVCALLSAENAQELGHLAPTIQICRQVHRRLSPLFPGFLASSQIVADELEKLSQLGDVIKIDAYRALCGPSRRIEIDDTFALLVGGGPVSMLPLAIRATLEIAGRSRVIGASLPPSIEDAFPIQRIEDWLELDNEDMLSWATDFVNLSLIAGKKGVAPDDLNILFRNRWVPIADFDGESDNFLARRQITIFGNRRYEYGVLRLRIKGEMKKTDAYLQIENDVARKLQGAIRSGKCTAERIQFAVVTPETIEVSIPHPLPVNLSRLLLLGWRNVSDNDEKPWPRKLRFSRKVAPLLSRGFFLMGYEYVHR